MPSYTLWRGDVLLGRFTEQQSVTHHGKRVGGAGLLQPTDAFSGVLPMMQTRARILPGAPIFQSPIEIDFNQADVRRAEASGPVALEPMSSEEARGVPADQVLVVRDDADNPIDADMVSLWLSILPADVDLGEISRTYGVAVTSRELWYVSFAKHDYIAT